MTSYIIGIILGSIVIAAAGGFLVFYFIKNRSFKKAIKQIGQKAEDAVNADLKVYAKHTNNKFIPAHLYKYNSNKVFEVDSILITDKALMVVEVKSIKGVIEGDAKARTWIKRLGDKTHEITNPIIQNQKHIEHVVKMTNLKVPTISLIIFSNKATNIKVTSKPSHVVVTRHAEMFDVLEEINSSLPSALTVDQMKELTSKIKKFRTDNPKDIQLHKRITEGRV